MTHDPCTTDHIVQFQKCIMYTCVILSRQPKLHVRLTTTGNTSSSRVAAAMLQRSPELFRFQVKGESIFTCVGTLA